MKYGVQVPIAEEIVAEMGEDLAWQQAARAVHGTGWQDAPCTEESLPQHAPAVDPETGEQLPPLRLYRFLYTLGGDA